MALQKRAAALLLTLGLATAATLSAGISGSGCVIDWADDCTHDRYAPGCKGGTLEITTGSGANGTGGRGTGSTDGGDGGPTGCKDPSTCPAVPAGPCASLGTVTCTGGVCGVTYTAGPAPSQVYGNCQQNVCDANGVMTTVDDNTNIFDNGTCNTYTCFHGLLTSTAIADAGAGCTMTGGTMGYCELNADPDNPGIFMCAGCNPLTDDPCSGIPIAPYCVSGFCVSMSCKDPNVECGGANCAPCADGKSCSVPADCFSHHCAGTPKTCVAPSCSDGLQNGKETDVDCGGGVCPGCATGYMCLLPTDCENGVCGPPQPGQPATCKAPTCTDGVQNGGETGVDCGGDGDGGPICPPCADGGQ